MTEASAVGTPEHPALLLDKYDGGAWKLWESLAEGRPELGRPSAFCGQVSRSKWVSFTGTCHRPDFFELIRDLTGNVPGEGGLVTFADSAWLMSIVLPHQPHFIDQPKDVDVFWGYGLSVERTGDFVSKPMEQCGGDEILQELLGHLGAGHLDDKRLGKITVIPGMMPFITSQFLCREKGDRPDVVPDGWQNLGLLGQFVELPDDVVFTVEYSVRSAQAAVARLLRLRSEPPPRVQGSAPTKHAV
ncbi:MCRA family protein [Rhizobium sp. BK376]|nr:MCRA family protein [Rhizobium sp. BK376]